MKIVRIVSILCLGFLLSGQSSEPDDLDAAFEKDVLVIAASEHACHVFDVYLAVSRQQKMRGLMYVRYMPPFTGMLFVYERAHVLSLWMKNTYIPLDMVFIRGDGTIANIETASETLSEKSIRSVEPLNFVLELNAGVTERLSIDTDSRVYLPDR